MSEVIFCFADTCKGMHRKSQEASKMFDDDAVTTIATSTEYRTRCDLTRPDCYVPGSSSVEMAQWNPVN